MAELKKVVIPSSVGRRRTKNFDRRTKSLKRRRVVHLSMEDEQSSTPPVPTPTFKFYRLSPKTQWFVPPIRVPLYWFDMLMLRRRLIVAVGPKTFVCDGHRFHAIAQDWNTQYAGVGYTRWLVYREDSSLPNNGAP